MKDCVFVRAWVRARVSMNVRAGVGVTIRVGHARVGIGFGLVLRYVSKTAYVV
jgi:hypothetical protein